MGFLGIGAAVIDIRVGEAGAPHHDATECGIALVFADESCELVRRDVVCLATWGSISSQRSCWHTEKDLGISRRGAGNKRCPLIIVKGCISALNPREQGSGIIVIIVELNPEIVKRGITDDYAHIRLRDRALRCSSDVIGVAGVRGEVRTQCRDHVRIVLAALVDLDVKVKAVNEARCRKASERWCCPSCRKIPIRTGR